MSGSRLMAFLRRYYLAKLAPYPNRLLDLHHLFDRGRAKPRSHMPGSYRYVRCWYQQTAWGTRQRRTRFSRVRLLPRQIPGAGYSSLQAIHFARHWSGGFGLLGFDALDCCAPQTFRYAVRDAFAQVLDVWLPHC
jgi:hypothetical protein